MKITLVQWCKIRDQIQEIKKQKDKLEEIIGNILLEHKNNPTERGFLINTNWDDVTSEMVTPQPEWGGGPTQGPESANTKTYLREPHIVGSYNKNVLKDYHPVRYFNPEEIAFAKIEGLASGDYTGKW